MIFRCLGDHAGRRGDVVQETDRKALIRDLLMTRQAQLATVHVVALFVVQRPGKREVMTDRHQWSSADIVAAFYGQSTVEQAFKNMKNPYHLAVTPEFHWTDQKIKVHYFSCVLGYLLATLVWRDARRTAAFTGTLDTLFDTLNNVRLTTLLELTGKSGKPRATRQLEEMTDEQSRLMAALDLTELHKTPLKIKGVGVYI